MSDLTHLEKRKLEKLLGMGTGYVLDFKDRTFIGRRFQDDSNLSKLPAMTWRTSALGVE